MVRERPAGSLLQQIIEPAASRCDCRQLFAAYARRQSLVGAERVRIRGDICIGCSIDGAPGPAQLRPAAAAPCCRRPGGEGAGSTRPRVNREPILHIATVRDPLDRFVSAYNDHGGGGGGIARCHVTQKKIEAALREGRKPPPPCPPLALELRKHAQRLADGRFITRLTPHHAGIHFFSQSYFLSATDRDGAPLEWDMLVRLERLEQE